MNDIKFFPQTKLIRAHDLKVITEAETLLETARASVAGADAFREEIARATTREIEDGMKSELRTRIAREVEAAVLDLRAQLQPQSSELASIVTAVSEKIWVDTPPQDRIKGLIQKALSEYANSQSIAICVCPADAEAMQQVVHALPTSNALPTVTVEGVADLMPGDILLRTDKGMVDIRFSRQIAEVRRALGV